MRRARHCRYPRYHCLLWIWIGQGNPTILFPILPSFSEDTRRLGRWPYLSPILFCTPKTVAVQMPGDFTTTRATRCKCTAWKQRNQRFGHAECRRTVSCIQKSPQDHATGQLSIPSCRFRQTLVRTRESVVLRALKATRL
ncbi:hypothetical protein EJ03DRAFT_118574 [Teratosphaeria nubilosa]|uniref:Uncharacterized protein n=1 Tax=Teratosphaeria nubilosa TaxID=161662 RepID=A0A6G1L6A5_9PEZI|nr:hypothetical protein EJ03DRAFT_118574 [Teratosphaeria nubilosa]